MTTPAAQEALRHFEALIPATPVRGGATEAYKNKDPLAYAISQVPIRTPRPVKIIVAGAGFSGLALAREVGVGNIKSASIQVYEKNGSVGGTWYENRYPGCACDIPVHNYQYSWAPYPHFPSYYAAGEHIEDYLEKVASQHNLRQFVKCSHKVVGAKWIEERQKWEIRVVRTDGRDLVVGNVDTHDGEAGQPFTEECDVFVNATGCFNNWKWPTIPNRENFRGTVVHSAAWPKDDSFLDGKTVALIGNGSTGVQILPAILDRVKKCYVFIRSRTWITAGFAQRFSGPEGSNLVFSEEQKKLWSQDPAEYLKYRKEVELELSSRFRLYLKDSAEQEAAKKFSIKQMQDKLSGKVGLAERLIPEFAVGCRRPTPGNGYLEALCSEKVEIVWGGIESFTENGLLSMDGNNYDVDNIICATGFNMAFAPRFPIIGRNGTDLKHKWETSPPECYISVTAADMPNYFIYMGPASPLGHGSVISAVEHVTGYIRMLITKLQCENYGSLMPKAHIPRAYQRQALAWLDKTAWSSDCVSTFKNGKKDGPLVSLHPGSRMHYFDLLENPRYEDFDWTSLCADPDMTFAWMANGFTLAETEKTGDLTYFLPPVEEKDHIHKTPGPTTNGHPYVPPTGANAEVLVKD